MMINDYEDIMVADLKVGDHVMYQSSVMKIASKKFSNGWYELELEKLTNVKTRMNEKMIRVFPG